MNKYNEVMDKVKVTDDMRKRILQNIENADISNVTAFEEAKKKKENKIVPFIKRYGAVAAMFAVVLVGAYAVFGTVGKHEMGSSSPMESYDATETAAVQEYAAEEAVEEAAQATEEAVDNDMDAGYESDSAPIITAPAMGQAVKEPAAQDKTKDSAKAESAEKDARNSDILEFASAGELSAQAGEEITDIESLVKKSTESHYLLYDDGMMEIDYFVDGANIYYRKVPEETVSEYASSDISGEFIGYSVVRKKTIGETTVTLKGTEETVNVASWTRDGYVYSLLHDRGLEDEAMTELLNEIIMR